MSKHLGLEVTELKVAIVTANAPHPFGPYSQAVKSGNCIYVSGQRPVHPENGTMPEGVVNQAKQVLKNIESILQEAGAGMEHVLKVNIYLADLNDFAAVNEVYANVFHEPYPARTTIGAVLRGILVEMDVVAELPNAE
ncbi:RidA family protein [Alicyclobacillus mengziensis]|uniref:RidA family protein n=1 Tax=Alicyclobacillus mengziensis TaxID=2931921 RepID=UPI0020120CBC|nr:Rid family detoxifying hydrolase [Alicyclobacillus mengziensis]